MEVPGWARKALRERISHVLRSRALYQRHDPVFDEIPDVVPASVDVAPCSNPNPRSIARRYTTSWPAMDAATYSTSAELSVTQSCRFAFQDIRALFKLRT
eukprot:2996701-Rhodomonas_salina.1